MEEAYACSQVDGRGSPQECGSLLYTGRKASRVSSLGRQRACLKQGGHVGLCPCAVVWGQEGRVSVPRVSLVFGNSKRCRASPRGFRVLWEIEAVCLLTGEVPGQELEVEMEVGWQGQGVTVRRQVNLNSSALGTPGRQCPGPPEVGDALVRMPRPAV